MVHLTSIPVRSKLYKQNSELQHISDTSRHYCPMLQKRKQSCVIMWKLNRMQYMYNGMQLNPISFKF